jgi:hypothetical protein
VAAPLIAFLRPVFCGRAGVYRTTAGEPICSPLAAVLVIPLALLAQAVILLSCLVIPGAPGRDCGRRRLVDDGASTQGEFHDLGGSCDGLPRGFFVCRIFVAEDLAYRIRQTEQRTRTKWMKSRLTPGDVLVAQGLGWTPLTLLQTSWGCGDQSPRRMRLRTLVYSAKDASRRAAGGEMRVMTITGENQNPTAVLAGACIAWTGPSPELVYQTLNSGSIRTWPSRATGPPRRSSNGRNFSATSLRWSRRPTTGLLGRPGAEGFCSSMVKLYWVLAERGTAISKHFPPVGWFGVDCLAVDGDGYGKRQQASGHSPLR